MSVKTITYKLVYNRKDKLNADDEALVQLLPIKTAILNRALLIANCPLQIVLTAQPAQSRTTFSAGNRRRHCCASPC